MQHLNISSNSSSNHFGEFRVKLDIYSLFSTSSLSSLFNLFHIPFTLWVIFNFVFHFTLLIPPLKLAILFFMLSNVVNFTITIYSLMFSIYFKQYLYLCFLSIAFKPHFILFSAHQSISFSLEARPLPSY